MYNNTSTREILFYWVKRWVDVLSTHLLTPQSLLIKLTKVSIRAAQLLISYEMSIPRAFQKKKNVSQLITQSVKAEKITVRNRDDNITVITPPAPFLFIKKTHCHLREKMTM